MGAHGEPLWPKGAVGSITHTTEVCAAAVGRACEYAGVGIDVEQASPLEAAVADRVALPEEQCGLPNMAPLLAARLIFSAKESFYKCQFYLTGSRLDFFDVRIDLTAAGHFFAELLVDTPTLARGLRVRGQWRQRDGFLLTALALGRDKR